MKDKILVDVDEEYANLHKVAQSANGMMHDINKALKKNGLVED